MWNWMTNFSRHRIVLQLMWAPYDLKIPSSELAWVEIQRSTTASTRWISHRSNNTQACQQFITVVCVLWNTVCPIGALVKLYRAPRIKPFHSNDDGYQGSLAYAFYDCRPRNTTGYKCQSKYNIAFCYSSTPIPICTTTCAGFPRRCGWY